ncbi:Inositol 2-dehydrogenase [Novipirellula galeiformis]|uniref:Inositol 2-dehydrogenase n=1 Tax=Novipirellula galeiformis TaxID=2528004 RepID=A0A5C6CA84_9BACT|nr:Gfo/Idh/MocA family oxidoreductase [Novipirellula galeiformis]TWU21052.1 Inositol 2-dehydrogenase [Novipirellula galeiformis]
MNHPTNSTSKACSQEPLPTRRKFIKKSGAISAGVASTFAATRVLRGDEPAESKPEPIRLAIVGAGGRGSGAVNDSLTINEGVKLVAIADLEERKCQNLRKSLSNRFPDKLDVKDGDLYHGLDAYKRVLDNKDVDVVMFATPPGFRAPYVLDAVDAGKHVFAEKPTCVDPAGYHQCLEADKKARANKTAIVTGTQYRRQTNYVEAIKRIHDGEIGDIVSATSRYCSNGIWYRQRKEGMSDAEYQLYNWMHFIWLSGDQICEQAVHNIDTINWVMGGPPVSAYGGGGRFTRPDDSEMWDNMAVDYVYPGDKVVSFICRQIPSTKSDNSNVIYGTKGTCTILGANSGASIKTRDGEVTWEMGGNIGDAYKQEHKALVDSIREGKPIVEFAETAASSLTAVLGRLAAYTGQAVTWDFVTNESKMDIVPKDLDIKGPGALRGVAIPGKEELV